MQRESRCSMQLKKSRDAAESRHLRDERAPQDGGPIMRALYVRGERAEYARTVQGLVPSARMPPRSVAHETARAENSSPAACRQRVPAEAEDRVSASREHDLAALLYMRRSAAMMRITPARFRRYRRVRAHVGLVRRRRAASAPADGESGRWHGQHASVGWSRMNVGSF